MPLAGARIARCAFAFLALVVAGQMSSRLARAEPAVVADDDAVTESEIEQRARLWANVPGRPYTHEQVIAELREEKRKIREARAAGVEVMNSDIELEYARMARRMNVTIAKMNEHLAEEGIDPDTIKHRIQADIAWQRYKKSRPKVQ
jgi:peptidyl-prolyl cis-trans isomerase SurA